jgi:hypothetical protein
VHSHNHCCCRKAISTTYSEWVSIASVIQHAKRMCNIIFICDLSGSTAFFHIISWTANFQKEVSDHQCVFWFPLQILSQIFLNLRRILWDVIINVHTSPSKVHIILVTFQSHMNFLKRFSKNIQISNFTKVCPVAA